MKKRLQTNSSLPRIETGAVNLYCCRKGLFDVGLVHSQNPDRGDNVEWLLKSTSGSLN